MMKIKSIFLIIMFAMFFGVYTSTAQTQVNDNDIVADVIAKKRAYNKRNGFGYRIQLYNGRENRAKSIRGRFHVEFPNVKTHLKYDAPEWKIQVGNYKTTLEADKALMEINMKFSGAIVIPIGK